VHALVGFVAGYLTSFACTLNIREVSHCVPHLGQASAHLETPADVKPDDGALLQYSGGTTRVPKAVMLTHRNLMSNNLQALTWMFKNILCRTPTIRPAASRAHSPAR
jgi:acyl-CoA synthetase (AMP-forming)/AMP-acid ligase II